MIRFIVFLFFLIFWIKIECFNPCNIDDSTCMPLEDFDENCTCILLPDDQQYNVTDEVYMFMTGYPIHISYFKQVEMQSLFREKLSVRIPQSNYYDTNDDFNENVYRNMQIDEKMALFEVSSTNSQKMMDYLIESEFLRTNITSQKESRWCLEGECNAFVYETGTMNRTVGIYSHAADLLQIIEYRGRSIIAVSSVFGSFSVPKAMELQCEYRCKPFYWSEREMCLKQCKLRLNFDQVAITGEMKRNFAFFIQSSAIQNFRQKYKKYINTYPRSW